MHLIRKAHLKNAQVRGVKSQRRETYDYYDESLCDEDNEVIEYFEMCLCDT